ncbi:response regulator [Archaeoglobales archaeon]|nr:MAG: response regulator [Archaeoglobales archaeon]
MVRVLIADDDDSIREILKIMLKDFEVVEASDGDEAVEMYKKFKPDIVLIDILMPGTNGVSATKKILEMDPNAIILGISAFAQSKGEDLLKAGAREIIRKPFTRKRLKETIEKHLES